MVVLDRLGREVEYLTRAHLRFALQDMVKHAPVWDDSGWGFLTIGLATEILRFYLGSDWVDTNVLGTKQGPLGSVSILQLMPLVNRRPPGRTQLRRTGIGTCCAQQVWRSTCLTCSTSKVL
jgi:hypothetical protein